MTDDSVQTEEQPGASYPGSLGDIDIVEDTIDFDFDLEIECRCGVEAAVYEGLVEV